MKFLPKPISQLFHRSWTPQPQFLHLVPNKEIAREQIVPSEQLGEKATFTQVIFPLQVKNFIHSTASKKAKASSSSVWGTWHCGHQNPISSPAVVKEIAV